MGKSTWTRITASRSGRIGQPRPKTWRLKDDILLLCKKQHSGGRRRWMCPIKCCVFYVWFWLCGVGWPDDLDSGTEKLSKWCSESVVCSLWHGSQSLCRQLSVFGIWISGLAWGRPACSDGALPGRYLNPTGIQNSDGDRSAQVYSWSWGR